MLKRIMLIFILISNLVNAAFAKNINSLTITQETLAALPHCIHYQMTLHFCLWGDLTHQPNTTPIISHYLPDLVVVAFNKPNENPWVEMNTFIDKAGEQVQKAEVKDMTGYDVGSGNHSAQDAHEQDVIFKEADVYGNPALMAIPSHGLLPSTATPLKPYFQSMVDSTLWRGLYPYSIPEEAESIGLSLAHHIGTGITNWGGIYPHEGKVTANNDVKASAVIAQRATDLLTNDKTFGHISQKLSTSCGEHCTAAPIQENSKETYFQMIYPIVQHDCYTLGDDDSYNDKMLNEDGAYVWVVWRHYEGCADGEGQYIGSI